MRYQGSNGRQQYSQSAEFHIAAKGFAEIFKV
jgi:hypothetical protein